MTRLSGKNIVITGAAGGQGQAACHAFLAEGANVLGVDIDGESLATLEEKIEDRDRFSTIVADASRGEDADRVAAAARDRLGRVDALYNNHGIILGKPLMETTEEEWDRIHDIDLKSVFLLTKAVVPLMQDQGGSIINVSSVGGLVAFANMAAYGAAKGGLAMFSKVAAVDLAPWKIRVNAICPGVIDTQMPRNFISDLPDRDEIWRGFEQGHLTGRLGRADEIVGLAVYLASDESTFMTGAVIPIDGGWSVQ
ncbi:SDR family NAD(P)-dependent oxidoreductase [Actinomycetospora termitidis]|uniref:SDR family oxidoreductase n=1 Tax=Actinomycetospora termitidis TaxID=3053470 RepID=A0ABT7M611_9PSEU|nr:SDR family oxidoreductase [Actinomycetospora sp. Odt1-22]MDL5156115.1 SDR family oxidoreductase [Actinomycetospora sp. Odt1-22]